MANSTKVPGMNILNSVGAININLLDWFRPTWSETKPCPPESACPTIVNDQIPIILYGHMAVEPIGLVSGVRTFGNPESRPGGIVEKTTVTYHQPRSAFLLTRERTAVRLIPISHPDNIAVILDHQIAIGMQIKTETPIRRLKELPRRHHLIGRQYR